MSTPDRPDIEEVREHAEFNAREGASGIGAGVVRSEYRNGQRGWECIVTDRQEWHYIEVIGSDLDAFPDLASEDIEQGIDRFAATLQSESRLYSLLQANPLHVDRTGQIND